MSVASCPRCGNERHRGRCKTKVAKEKPAPAKPDGSLEVAAGRGFRASIDDGALLLQQDVVDEKDGELYTHQISLSPYEARQLVDWVEAKVKAA